MTVLPFDGSRKYMYLPRVDETSHATPQVFAVEVFSYDNERKVYAGAIFEVDYKSGKVIGEELPFEVHEDGYMTKFAPPKDISGNPCALMCTQAQIIDLVLHVITTEEEIEETGTPEEEQEKQEKLEVPVHPRTIEELTQSAVIAAKINGENADALLASFYNAYGKYVEKHKKKISVIDYYNKYYWCRWTKHPGDSFTDADQYFLDFLRQDEKEFLKEHRHTPKKDYEATREDLFYNWRDIIIKQITHCINAMHTNPMGKICAIETYVSWMREYVLHPTEFEDCSIEITNEVMKLHKRD